MDSTFLGQGSYGCVYKQKLRCTKHDSIVPLKPIKYNKNILSKIYLDKKYATREIEIGKHITKIPNYKHYFSPVLENCNASLAQITDDDIDKCDLLKETIDSRSYPTYFTTMTKYIKGQTLDQYLSVTQRCETNKTMNKVPTLSQSSYDNKIFYIYTCLTKSIEILNSHNITHFDLSERNIIMDTTDRPMIIDYGMSIKTDTIKTEEEFRYEFGHYEYTDANNKLELYEPWCVEIILLIYLNRTTTNELSNDVIETMKSLSDSYIDLLKMENLHFTQEEIAKYKESKHALYEQFKGNTTYEASNELLKTSTHWDQYALTIICLKHLVDVTTASRSLKHLVDVTTASRSLKHLVDVTTASRSLKHLTLSSDSSKRQEMIEKMKAQILS
jgi:serine/threonine protein kinase